MSLPVIVLLAALAPCRLSHADRVWRDTAVAAWRTTSAGALQLPPRPLPEILFFDETCVWRASGDRGVKHNGTLDLPDGNHAPVQLMTFAGTYGKDAKPFMVMAMPAIWRKSPRHAGEATLDTLINAVFIHEMTHTRQAQSISARIEEGRKAAGLPEDITDDIIQDQFGKDDAFRAAYEKERDLLFAAAAEHDRAKAREAVAAMKARRATFFTKPGYAELEDTFLNMEGVAQWAAYAYTKESGAADPLALMRRGGKHWSQDEGLAVFLVLDAFVPNWQKRVFADEPVSLMELLEEV